MKIIRDHLQNIRGSFQFVRRAICIVSSSNMSRQLILQFFVLIALKLLNSLSFSGIVAYTLSGVVFGIPYPPEIISLIPCAILPLITIATILNFWYPLHRYRELSWVNSFGQIDDIIIPLVPTILFFVFAIWQPFSLIGFASFLAFHLFTTILLLVVPAIISPAWLR